MAGAFSVKRTPMKRHGPRTKKSGGHLFPKLVDETFRDWIRTKPCVLRGRMRSTHWTAFGLVTKNAVVVTHECVGRVRACHVKSRGSSGPDAGNLYPGCDAAHDEQGRIGLTSFERRWNLNLREIAANYALTYRGWP